MSPYASIEEPMRILTAAELGLVVREGRASIGWSQTRLADVIGCTRQWVAALERGKPTAELGLTLRTLTALGVRLDAVTAPATAELSEHASGSAKHTRPARSSRSAVRP
jgi:HTH-type transcriptional regulator/antitoxin HipB